MQMQTGCVGTFTGDWHWEMGIRALMPMMVRRLHVRLLRRRMGAKPNSK